MTQPSFGDRARHSDGRECKYDQHGRWVVSLPEYHFGGESLSQASRDQLYGTFCGRVSHKIMRQAGSVDPPSDGHLPRIREKASESRSSTPARMEARRALSALRLEVPKEIADDVQAKVYAAFAEIEGLRPPSEVPLIDVPADIKETLVQACSYAIDRGTSEASEAPFREAQQWLEQQPSFDSQAPQPSEDLEVTVSANRFAKIQAALDLLPPCYVFHRTDEWDTLPDDKYLTCLTLIGATFPRPHGPAVVEGPAWTEAMCCLPCRVRKALGVVPS